MSSTQKKITYSNVRSAVQQCMKDEEARRQMEQWDISALDEDGDKANHPMSLLQPDLGSAYSHLNDMFYLLRNADTFTEQMYTMVDMNRSTVRMQYLSQWSVNPEIRLDVLDFVVNN